MNKRERLAAFEKDFDACICRMVYAAGAYKNRVVEESRLINQPPEDAYDHFLQFAGKFVDATEATYPEESRLIIV